MFTPEKPKDNANLRPDLSQITVDQMTDITRGTAAKLRVIEAARLPGETFLSWFEQDLKTTSASQAAKEIGVAVHTALRIAKAYGIPTLSQIEATKAKWADPNFRQMRSQQVSAQHQDPKMEAKRLAGLKVKWQDKAYRERQARGASAKWQDPKFRQMKSQQIRSMHENPELEGRRVAGIKARWQDQDFRQRSAVATSAVLRAQWQNPEFRRRQIEDTKTRWADDDYREKVRKGSKAKWQEPEFRARMGEITRQTRINPDYIGRFVLPTIYGNRQDIGYAQSAWEANLTRVIMMSGREYIQREPLRLVGGSILSVDFITIDGRNRMVAYEIMAHPKEDPDGWIKLENAVDQYPYIVFRVVDARFYERLRRRFQGRINVDTRFAGWESIKDSLRTNPQKYAGRVEV